MTMQSNSKPTESCKPRRFGFLFGARGRRSQRGQAMMELAVALPLLMIVIAGAVDFGTGCYIAIEVTSAARSGAQYGVQNAATMIDITGMELAAQERSTEHLDFVHHHCRENLLGLRISIGDVWL